MEKKKFQPDQVLSYFKSEWPVLLAVTISGLIYNIGLLAGPWFEGRMAGKLIDILQGRSTFQGMLFFSACLCGSNRDRAEQQIHQALLCQTLCQ